MFTKKGIFFLTALFALGYLAFFFVTFTDQPYYNSGIEITLTDEGYKIKKVIPLSNAASAGLQPGMIISRLNGLDTIGLNGISKNDLPAFLSISSRLFEFGKTIKAETAAGTIHSFTVVHVPWLQRFSLFKGTLLLNLAIGVLFIAFGVWLLAVGRKTPAVTWFLLFSVAAGIAISVSFFNSYWSLPLIYLRFVTLDIAGVAACIFLLCFVHHFPVSQAYCQIRLFTIPAILLSLKYILLVMGLIDFFGPAIFFIHSFLFVSFTYTIIILVKRHREAKSGNRRRLRWIIAGVALSLIPYILYVLSLLASADILTNGSTFLNYISSISILFFPISVTIGVIRYSLFDIDRFLNRFFVLFFLGVIVSVLYSLIFLLFFETKISMSMYSLLLITALLSPGLYRLVNFGINYILQKRHRDKKHILLELEENLIGIYKIDEVYSIVSSAILSAFDPTFIAFKKNGPSGFSETEFRYPLIADPSTDENDKKNLSFILHQKNGIEDILVIGKNKDDDIYTHEDIHLLTNTASHITKTIEYCDLHIRLQESIENESGAHKMTILSLAKLTEYRDHETGRHLERIISYTRLIATQLQNISVDKTYLTDEYINDLCISSILHDIGKVGIPDQILMKPGKLSPEEFDNIKTHTVIGGNVLEETELMNTGRTFLTIGKLVAYHHHEKWDGSGYPYGLNGEAIPLSARIVAIADVYDALRSERPYKKAFTHEQAIDIIVDGRGKHFDPELVDILLSIESDFKSVSRISVAQ